MPFNKIIHFLRAIGLSGILIFFCCDIRAQAKLMLNGAAIVLVKNAALVIGNSDNQAIQRLGAGYISSEGPDNRIIWQIGAGNGNEYVIPFGTATRYFPFSFKAGAGEGAAGYFIFSTFPTFPINSSVLPSGVTNMTISGGDNSLNTVDRFWQIKPQDYTKSPDLTNLSFSYSPAELTTPNNITEANLMAYRWNDGVQKWNDVVPSSTDNTGTHTVTVSAISGTQLFDWWALSDAVGAPLPVTLLHFTARVISGQVLTSWQTAMEQNTDRFEVWRSTDNLSFELTGSVPAAGNSTRLLNYSFTDAHPYNGTSYYKLKMVDSDARFTWSDIIPVQVGNLPQPGLFPNPATTEINIISSTDIMAKHPMAVLYDAQGQRLKEFPLKDTIQKIDVSTLARGIYQFEIIYENQSRTIRFLKL